MRERKETRHNARTLQKAIVKNLAKSKMWIVLRLDNEGVHLDMPNDDHLALLGVFFNRFPDILEMVNDFVESQKNADS